MIDVGYFMSTFTVKFVIEYYMENYVELIYDLIWRSLFADKGITNIRFRSL